MPIHNKVNKNFFKKWSYDMAYVLGLLSADGSIRLSKRGAWYIDIGLIDKDLIKKVRGVLGSDHKISIRKKNSNEQNMYRLQIGSKELCKDLEKLGVVRNKTKIFDLPNIPKKYTGSYLRGYFDGDGDVWVGYINKHRSKHTHILSTRITSCSKCILAGMKDIVENEYGHTSCLFRKKNSDCFVLQFSTNASIMLYYLMYKDLDSCLYLNRKKTIFEYFLKMRG